MVLLFILMFLSYAATVYFLVHPAFFCALLCFVANSCLTLVCILKLLHHYQSDTVPHKSSDEIMSVDKRAYIEQASHTIAHLQLANEKLKEENKRLERLIHEK